MSDDDRSSLRVVTLNVHEFADAEHEQNFARLEAFLRPLNADVVCLQEAIENSFRLRSRDADLDLSDRTHSDLHVFGARCGYPHVVFGAAHTSFGVAVLSRWPFVKVRCATLSRHRVLLITAIAKHARCFTVCNVHLNHRLEKNRIDEIQAALAVLQSDDAAKALAIDAGNGKLYFDFPPADKPNFCDPRDCANAAPLPLVDADANAASAPPLTLVPGAILCGDFNALSVEDHYLPEQWRHIVESRRSVKWEEPRTDVWRLMMREGWCDCWLAQNTARLSDPTLKRTTVWAKSRIDYVFASGDALKAALRQCEVHETDGLTDHDAVVADFECE
jgi:endonuclease/exonuclease/phosphatase family metal-dependent hydrolase